MIFLLQHMKSMAAIAVGFATWLAIRLDLMILRIMYIHVVNHVLLLPVLYPSVNIKYIYLIVFCVAYNPLYARIDYHLLAYEARRDVDKGIVPPIYPFAEDVH